MKNNFLFKTFLIAQTVIVLIYTIWAFKNEGVNLLSVFLENIQSLTWNGQFNLDFSSYLSLSALWIMWRNRFSSSSIVIGIIAMIIGIIVFAPYLLYLLGKEKGDLKKLLIGNR